MQRLEQRWNVDPGLCLSAETSRAKRGSCPRGGAAEESQGFARKIEEPVKRSRECQAVLELHCFPGNPWVTCAHIHTQTILLIPEKNPLSNQSIIICKARTCVWCCIGCFGERRLTWPTLGFTNALLYVNKQKPCSWRRDRAFLQLRLRLLCPHTRHLQPWPGKTVPGSSSRGLRALPTCKCTPLVWGNFTASFEMGQGTAEHGIGHAGGESPLALVAY